MNNIGLMQIHNVLNRNDGECCYICFRPVSERKLVDPVYLDTLISKLANVTFFTLQNSTQVCYVCEALAKSAVRFIKAVELAARVSELFSDMEAEQWADIEKHLVPKTGRMKSPQVPNGSLPLRRALRLERALRRSARGSLQRTDTLVVAGPAPAPAPPPPAQLRPDMVLVMPDNQLQMAPVLPPMMQVMSPLVLPQLSIHSDQNHVRVLNQETNEFILHPMVKGMDGNIYVPSLHVQIQDNGILKNVTDAFLKKRLPTKTNTVSTTTNRVSSVATHRVSTHTESQSEKTNCYSFLSNQRERSVNNMEIIKMNELNIVLNDDNSKKRKLEELDQTLSEVTRLLSENTQGSCDIKYEIIDDDDEPNSNGTENTSNEVENIRVISGNAGRNSRVISGNAVGSTRGTSGNVTGNTRDSNTANHTSKEPVLTTDRTVDWEDKIPMDVISFMDATDPNPQERIMQPGVYTSQKKTSMGVISDVRSVTDVPGTRDIECIDLC